MHQKTFTSDFFSKNIPSWSNLLDQVNPRTLLEIGSFEGRSTCFLIDYLSNKFPIEMHCVDTWAGGAGKKDLGIDYSKMSEHETRFRNNIEICIRNAPNNVDFHAHKGFSDDVLSKLLAADYANYFDFIYIDGSHQAPDVLIDAVLSFKLAKVGGVLVFDDYLWEEQLSGGTDFFRCPKPAIDAFTSIFMRKVKIISAPLYQLYAIKISD
jgi:hypothetical protein